MANPNVGQRVAQAWDAYIGDKPEDAISDEYTFLSRLVRSKAYKSFTGGGDNILGAVEYKLNDTVAWISDTETLNTSRVDVFDQYTYPWREIGETVVMSEFESAINRGDAKKFDLLAGKLENAKKSMQSTINAACFTAQSGKAILGLPDLVANSPTSGTVGGINRANFSFWRNQQASGAKSSTAFDNLRGAMRTINAACSRGQGVKEPSYFVGTSTDVNGYESLLVANERVVSKEDSQANAGFRSKAFKFKQAAVIWDRDCASGTMYALQDDDPCIAYQAGKWFKMYPAVDPANQLAEIYKFHSILQFLVKNPRHLGVITSIT